MRARPRRREPPRDHVLDGDARETRDPEDHVHTDAIAIAHVGDRFSMKTEGRCQRLPAARPDAQVAERAASVLLLRFREGLADHDGTDAKDGSIPSSCIAWTRHVRL